MRPMNQPIDWTANLETNTGAPARMVAGPDFVDNFTVEGNFDRGVERRYCSDNGGDVGSLLRFARPVMASQADAARIVTCGCAWHGGIVTMPPARARKLAGNFVPPKVSRSIPAPA